MKAFIIHPIRKKSELFHEGVIAEIESLKKQGYDVYDPEQDTNQEDDTGLRICKDNLHAIKDADVIFFMWDGKSQGCLFDLGIAFALNKKILPIKNKIPPLTNDKSFQNMIWEYSEKS